MWLSYTVKWVGFPKNCVNFIHSQNHVNIVHFFGGERDIALPTNNVVEFLALVRPKGGNRTTLQTLLLFGMIPVFNGLSQWNCDLTVNQKLYLWPQLRWFNCTAGLVSRVDVETVQPETPFHAVLESVHGKNNKISLSLPLTPSWYLADTLLCWLLFSKIRKKDEEKDWLCACQIWFAG